MSAVSDDELRHFTSRLKDRVVLITGAASGIGRETALQFASHGAKVVIGDLNAAGAQKTVKDIEHAGGTAISFKCDVTDWEEQVAMFECAIANYGAVDVVVANAGVSELGKFNTVEFKDGKPVKPNTRTLDVNLFGVLYTTHLALHYLEMGRVVGSNALKAIVFLGSMASWVGIPRGAMYTSSKHAVLGLMRSLYPEFRLRNIRIATIHPFFADTDILPVTVKLFLAGVPLSPISRIAAAVIYAATNPDPETNGVAFLLSDDGPVFMIPREEFKLGVYKMIDERANALFKGAVGTLYYARLTKDIVRIIGKPTLMIAIVAGATKMIWNQREQLLKHLQSYV